MSQEEHSAVSGLDKLYEFDREPVSEDKLQPGKHFAGLLAGEHVAGTEFVIGAMFVGWGASAFDIFVGLAIGNLLAVLTWALLCAPIATQTRLTLYWYLRKIAGPATTVVYNILNAVLFCILAGCMITVSASAVRIVFDIPRQTQMVPTSIGFVVVVLVVGAVVTLLAILGFKRVAQFSSVCSPWMFLMFLGGAVAVLPTLYKAASEPGFWNMANEIVWTGRAPDGATKISFWHVVAFAWICNLAMHGGLSDMALFRYAKHPAYGLYSAFGMFFGHYLAWIFAGMMGAAAGIVLNTANLDPGDVASTALGATGILAVIIAGWTTSNPTLYRAGLAFQGITPGWPRWIVTLATGTVTTIIACFPFVFTKLLDFVGLYGLLLMPVGAIVFVEHWIFPRIGFTQYWASKKKVIFSWPALLSWAIAMAAALALERTGTLHLFFLFLPVWFLTAILYTIFAAFAGARDQYPDEAEEPAAKRPVAAATSQAEAKPAGPDMLLIVAQVVSLLSLAACLILPLWVGFGDDAGYDARLATFHRILIWPTILYFIFGTVWAVRRDKNGDSPQAA